MSREIKFRAWDEQNKIMHSDFQFISSGDEGNDWIIFISDKYPLENNDTNPFRNPSPYFSQQLKKMQYTELKAKGVEIYEGDICINEVYWEEPREIGFNCLGTLCSKVKGDENSFHMSILKHIEVIGNIHENPELLEAKS